MVFWIWFKKNSIEDLKYKFSKLVNYNRYKWCYKYFGYKIFFLYISVCYFWIYKEKVYWRSYEVDDSVIEFWLEYRWGLDEVVFFWNDNEEFVLMLINVIDF